MITNIPRQDLNNLVALFRALPFPNNDRLGLKISITTPLYTFIDIQNNDGDGTVSVTTSYEFDNSEIESVLKTNTDVKSLESNVKNKLEELEKEIARLSAAYRTAKPLIWRYLNSLPQNTN